MKIATQGELIPGTVYSPTMHAHAVKIIHEAVTQSGAKYTTGIGAIELSGEQGYSVIEPLGNDVSAQEVHQAMAKNLGEQTSVPKSLQASLGKVGIMGEEKSKLVTNHVREWVVDFIKIGNQTVEDESEWRGGEYDWAPIPLEDPFLVAHREEIILEAIDKFSAGSGTALLNLVRKLSPEGVISESAASKLALVYPVLVMIRSDLFPHFRFDKTHIDLMSDGSLPGGLSSLMKHWKSIKPDCLQYAADKAMEQGVVYMEPYLRILPDTIKIPEEFIMKMISKAPWVLIDLLDRDRFPEMKSNIKFIRELSLAGYRVMAMETASQDLLSRLSVAEIVHLFGDAVNIEIFEKLNDLGKINNEADMYELLRHVDVSRIASRKILRLPTLMQSCIFQALVTQSGGDEWVNKVGFFNHLREDDYIFLLDHADILMSGASSLTRIHNVFFNAEGEIRRRFESEIDPKLAKVEDESRARSAKNFSRKERRKLEDEYFKSGNIKLSAHDYSEALSDEAIIDALEKEHCVRQIGGFRDIAHDPTRTNGVMCVDGTRQLTSAALGSNVPEQDRVVRTEHEALQQLLDFCDSQTQVRPDNIFFGNFINELSFVGEKEYAEAVKGIATYWKWFLDQDGENQLYVDAVISGETTCIKSDMYMLDRVLAHFSDDDMEKYWGRLLTKETDIIQSNPRKVKVVLLDDWTISGSQLRGGYSEFAQKNPTLVSSIEIQLIVAAAERIALGMEQASYYSDNNNELEETHIPIVTRAYYVAHTAEMENKNFKDARISGSHSSVDFGFSCDIARNMGAPNKKYPLLTNVIRPYRQIGYELSNIARLEEQYGMKGNRTGREDD